MFTHCTEAKSQEPSSSCGSLECARTVGQDSAARVIDLQLIKENVVREHETIVVEDTDQSNSNSAIDVDISSATVSSADRQELASASKNYLRLLAGCGSVNHAEEAQDSCGMLSSYSCLPPRSASSYTNINVLLSRPNPSVNDAAGNTTSGGKASTTGTTSEGGTRFYRCQHCATEYNCPELLDAHLKYYCLKRHTNKDTHCPVLKDLCSDEWQRSGGGFDPDSKAVEVSKVLTTPSTTILLPCGYVDNGGVQVIGRPQTVIPVAVPRDSPFAVSPLVIEEGCIRNVDILCDRISLASSSKTDSSPFFLPLICGNASFEHPIGCSSVSKSRLADTARVDSGQMSCIRSTDGMKPDATATASTAAAASEAGKSSEDGATSERRTATNDMVPTAVTMSRIPFAAIPETHDYREVSCPAMRINDMVMLTHPLLLNQTSEMSSARLPKNYTCENCGICFLSEKTLIGHQQYYCRTTPNRSEAPQDGGGELACQQCGYTSSSPSQLWRHNKYSHTSPHTFICILCGYRGYSLRGVKSHLKFVHNTELRNIRDEPSVMSVPENGDSSYQDASPRSANVSADASHKRPEFSGLTEDCSGSAGGKRRRLGDKENPVPVVLCTACEGKFVDYQTFFTHACPRSNKMCRGPQNGATLFASGITEVQTSEESFSLYECRFCRYRSAYKGNVKRHLNLVHHLDVAADASSMPGVVQMPKLFDSLPPSAPPSFPTVPTSTVASIPTVPVSTATVEIKCEPSDS